MQTTIEKKWVNDYITLCCEVLGEDTDHLTASLEQYPGGHDDWLGALISDLKGNATMELSDQIKNIPYWRKIILHECLHYKMRYIDPLVQISIPDFLRAKKKDRKRVSKAYNIVLENYIEGMTDALFPIVEKFNNGA